MSNLLSIDWVKPDGWESSQHQLDSADGRLFPKAAWAGSGDQGLNHCGGSLVAPPS